MQNLSKTAPVYDRQPLQKFIGQCDWDDEIIIDKIVQKIKHEIGTENGVLILDPTSFPKKGCQCVGVQRQWCGRLGKVENCQVATLLAYAGTEEFALVDRRLYLPKEWVDDPDRCRGAGVPEEHIVEKTRHEQSLEMIITRGKKLPHRWIAGDDEMGRIPWFRKELRNINEPYLLAIPSNFLVYDLEVRRNFRSHCGGCRQDDFVNVQKWMKAVPKGRWKKIKVRLGHKGWLTVNLAKCRVLAMIEGEIGEEETLIVSRWKEDTGKPDVIIICRTETILSTFMSMQELSSKLTESKNVSIVSKGNVGWRITRYEIGKDGIIMSLCRC